MTRERKLIIALVGVAVLARVAAAVALGSKFHFADETEYVDTARRLLAGEGFGIEFKRVPAYPVYLAFLLRFTPTPLVLLRIVHGIIAALSCWLTFRLADRFFGLRAATMATLFVALDPLVTVSSTLFYPEAIAAVVVLLTVTLVVQASRDERLAASAAVGALLGLAAQLRQVSLFFLPLMLVWTYARARVPRIRRGSLHAAVLLAAFLLVLTPWSLRNYGVHGSFSPIATAGVPGTPVAEAARSRQNVVGAMLNLALHDTKWLIQVTAKKFVAFWELYPTRLATDKPEERVEMHAHDNRLPVKASFPRGLRDTVSTISFGSELVLAIIGIGFALQRRRAESLLLLGAILSFAFGYSLFVSKMRYRIPILPLLFIFSGVGLSGLLAMLRPATAEKDSTRD